MNIENLNHFRAVVELKSISKAAMSNHITQSALTQIIKKIEDDLEVVLLERSNKGVVPTEYGELVYEYAKSLSDTYDAMKERLACIKNGCMNVVIKPCCALDNQLIPNALFKIQSDYKNIRLDVVLDDKDKIINEVRSGVTDIGICMGETPDDGTINDEILGIERIVLVAGPSEETGKTIPVDALDRFRIIDFSLGSYTSEINKMLGNCGRDSCYIPFFSIDSISAIKTLVESGFGVSFLPYDSVRSDLKSGKLKEISLRGFELSLPIHMLTRSDALLQPVIRDVKKTFLKTALSLFGNVR
jgi:LysR family transcriptional regulator, transcriptional activator of the cysJI operon